MFLCLLISQLPKEERGTQRGPGGRSFGPSTKSSVKKLAPARWAERDSSIREPSGGCSERSRFKSLLGLSFPSVQTMRMAPPQQGWWEDEVREPRSVPSTRGVSSESDGPLPSSLVSPSLFCAIHKVRRTAVAAGMPGNPRRARHRRHAHRTPPTHTPPTHTWTASPESTGCRPQIHTWWSGAERRTPPPTPSQLSAVQPSRSAGSLSDLEAGASPHFPDSETEPQGG